MTLEQPNDPTQVATDAAGTPPLDGLLATVALSALQASGFNPRRTFDADALAELAESIAAKGVLQNLVVRRAKRGKFDVIAGERRLRALMLLAEAGRWARDAETVPVRIVEAEPAAALEIALLENLQRTDVPVMEEAEGFARLVGEFGYDTDRIAGAVRRTRRHVQLRLQLVNDLEAPAQKALAAGEINLAAARALTGLPKKAQGEGLKMAKMGNWDPAAIRSRLLHDKPKVSAAPFDLALYTGAYIGEAEDTDRRFADPAEYHKLVSEEAERRAATRREKWAEVEIVDCRKSGTWFNSGNYSDGGKAGEPDGLTVIEIRHDGEIKEHTGLRRPREVERRGKVGSGRGAKAKAEDRPPFPQNHISRANAIKTAWMQRAIAGAPGAALRLAVLALAGNRQVTIRTGEERWGNLPGEIAPPPLPDHTPKALAKMPNYEHASKESETAWRALLELTDKEVLQIFAAQVAAQFATNLGQPKLGDSPLFQAVAEHVGLDMAGAVTTNLARFDAAWFDAYNRDALWDLAAGAGAEVYAAVVKAAGVEARAKTGDVRLALLKLADAGQLAHVVPRELRVGDTAAISAPLATQAQRKEAAAAVKAAAGEQPAKAKGKGRKSQLVREAKPKAKRGRKAKS